MFWNVKKIEETESYILIGFSKNESFDGLIKYNKQSNNFELVSIAKDCDEFESRRLFQFLFTMISRNTLSFTSYKINLG